MCLRGSRSSRGRPALPAVGEGDIELALIEGRVEQSQTPSYILWSLVCYSVCTLTFSTFIVIEKRVSYSSGVL